MNRQTRTFLGHSISLGRNAACLVLLFLGLCISTPAFGFKARPGSDCDTTNPQHPDERHAVRFSPILWFAPDEESYPLMPLGAAFDSLDNDANGFIDLNDPFELLLLDPDFDSLAKIRKTANQLRGRRVSIEVVNATGDSLLPRSLLQEGAIHPQLRQQLQRKGVQLDENDYLRSIGANRYGVFSRLVVIFEPGGLVFDRDTLWSGPGERRFRGEVGPTLILTWVSDASGSRLVAQSPAMHPPPRVGYRYDPNGPHGHRALQYWMYYLYDTGVGAHSHDAELVAVFVDSTESVRAVVGTGHTDASPNNILYSSSRFRDDQSLPATLPWHMPILVELGKHASAPDRHADGRFDIGADANAFYKSVWGTRDISSALRATKLGRFRSEYSFPRMNSGLLFEENLHALRLKNHLASQSCDDLHSKSANFRQALKCTDATLDALESADRDNLRRLDTSQAECSREHQMYSLYPVADLDSLAMLLRESAPDSSGAFLVRAFIDRHKHCLWERPPQEVLLPILSYRLLRVWANRVNSKSHIWKHRNSTDTDRVFKQWLYPRLNPSIAGLTSASGAELRLALSASEFDLGFIAMHHGAIQAFYDIDLSDLHGRQAGLFYNDFRGGHTGWFAGLGWSRLEIDAVRPIAGLAVVSWHPFTVLAQISGDLNHGERLGLLDLKLGLALNLPGLKPRHPLRY